MLVVLLAACGLDFQLDPTDPVGPPDRRVIVTETFAQAALPAVDLLFVIDDTGSMQQEQAALADSFDALVAGLGAVGIAWQVGVTTTEGVGADAGWLRGSPYVISASTPSPEAAFAAAVAVGTSGQGPEAGFAAALTALSLADDGGPNAGFRRPDAVLRVVFFSDADDASDTELGADPVGAFLVGLAAQTTPTGAVPVVSAVVGDLPSGCTSESGAASAGERYHAVVDATGGVSASICAPDFGPLLEAISQSAVTYPRSFPLADVPLAGAAVVVRVDGVAVADGWAIDPAVPALVFDAPPAAGATIAIDYVVEITEDP